jgi:hypothetical protein
MGISGRHLPLKIAAPTKESSPHHWKFSRIILVRDLNTAFNLPMYTITYQIVQATSIRNHENEHVRGIGQHEARHRKYKRLKLGSGQAYNHSSD